MAPRELRPQEPSADAAGAVALAGPWAYVRVDHQVVTPRFVLAQS